MMRIVHWRNNMGFAPKWLWYFQFFRYAAATSPRDSRLRAAIKSFRAALGYRTKLRGGW
jgi:hypothetical protein